MTQEHVAKPEHIAIRRAVAAIPPGRVASYGEVAARAGLPRRARLVGRVLRDAGDGARLPWHRVLRADGRIAFAAGTRAYREQRQRLLAEGVRVTAGKVDLTQFGWQRDLDAELWKF
jgi:methylated-DNA-protein-cysteine methyltransferase-like protein